MCEIRRLKIKRQVTKPADVGFKNCLFREAEGYKLTQNLPFATDPQYKNGKKKKRKGAAKNYLSISNKSSSSRAPTGRLKGLNAGGC